MNYSVPEFIDVLKECIFNKKPELIEQKLHLSARLKAAQNFFSRDISQSDIQKGVAMLNDILTEMNRIEEDLAIIDSTIFSILESKLANVSFKIKADGYTDALGNKVVAQDIYFVPWRTTLADSRVEITPEDLWFIRTAERMFGVKPDGVTLLERDKEVEIFSQSK